jgi:hypothetical protein
METDLDRALWNIVDKEYHKKQARDAPSCVTDGANVNCLRPMDLYGDDVCKLETPLLVAVYRQNPELVKRLLEMGANLSANTNAYGGRTVLHIAALHNNGNSRGRSCRIYDKAIRRMRLLGIYDTRFLCQ